jgi:hypothetical protein
MAVAALLSMTSATAGDIPLAFREPPPAKPPQDEKTRHERLSKAEEKRARKAATRMRLAERAAMERE